MTLSEKERESPEDSLWGCGYLGKEGAEWVMSKKRKDKKGRVSGSLQRPDIGQLSISWKKKSLAQSGLTK